MQKVPFGRSVASQAGQSSVPVAVSSRKSKLLPPFCIWLASELRTKWWAPYRLASSSFDGLVEKAKTSAPIARAN